MIQVTLYYGSKDNSFVRREYFHRNAMAAAVRFAQAEQQIVPSDFNFPAHRVVIERLKLRRA